MGFRTRISNVDAMTLSALLTTTREGKVIFAPIEAGPYESPILQQIPTDTE
jgi:hypothetical protein